MSLLNGERLVVFPLILGTRQEFPLSLLEFYVLTNVIRQENEDRKIGKEYIKLNLQMTCLCIWESLCTTGNNKYY